MKKIITAALLSAVLCSSFAPISQAGNTPSVWAEKEVSEALTERLLPPSVMKDYQAQITREQFCELVTMGYERISGNVMSEEFETKFDDTNNPYILFAADLGIVKGVGNGRFSPEAAITREQIALMIVRMIDKAVSDAEVDKFNENDFADKALISPWASDAVNFAYDNGIMQGTGNNSISPKSNTTCEQAIALVYRTFKKYYIYAPEYIEPPAEVERYDFSYLHDNVLLCDFDCDGVQDTLQTNQYVVLLWDDGWDGYPMVQSELIINGKRFVIDVARHGYYTDVIVADIDPEDEFTDIILINQYKGATATVYRYQNEQMKCSELFTVSNAHDVEIEKLEMTLDHQGGFGFKCGDESYDYESVGLFTTLDE